MLISFDNLPDNARVWIYQADRKLTSTEEEKIKTISDKFLDEWAAHGAPLKCAFKIFHRQFLIVGVDESYNQVSGCSIDSSVGFIKELEQKLNISFFDRTKIAFVHNNEIFLESLHDIKASVAAGKVSDTTLTFNNLVSTKSDLETSWIVPAKTTWLSKYFKQVVDNHKFK